MELDNNNGNDLDAWETLQKKWAPEKNTSPYLFAYNISVKNGDLLVLGDRCINMDLVKSKSKEAETLKAYTLLASLTSRISQKIFHPMDKNKISVFKELLAQLTNILDTPERAHFLSFEAASKMDKSYITARNINTKISQMMKSYFKI